MGLLVVLVCSKPPIEKAAAGRPGNEELPHNRSGISVDEVGNTRPKQTHTHKDKN